MENLSESLYKKEWQGWRQRSTLHLLERHQGYLTNTSVTEDNYRECSCTLGVMVASVMEQIRDEDIVWSGEWLRLNEDEGEDDLRSRVKGFLSSPSPSLLHKHLTLEVFDQLKLVRTPGSQGGLKDQIQAGLALPSSPVGVFASDPEAYSYFSLLLSPILRELHGVQGKLQQPPAHWGEELELEPLPGVSSSRVQAVRSLQGFPFLPLMTLDDLLSLEQTVVQALSSLTGDLQGSYSSLASLPQREQEELAKQHLLPPPCSQVQRLAQSCRHWPAGRGVFWNSDRTLLVWVGGQEHLTLVSQQPGGDLGSAYKRLVVGLAGLENGGLVWVRGDSMGYLTSDPASVGTGLRLGVVVQGARGHQVAKRVGQEGLQVQEQGREVEVYLQGRLGVTEIHSVKTFHRGMGRVLN